MASGFLEVSLIPACIRVATLVVLDLTKCSGDFLEGQNASVCKTKGLGVKKKKRGSGVEWLRRADGEEPVSITAGARQAKHHQSKTAVGKAS